MVTRGNSDFVAGIEACLTGIITDAQNSYKSFKESYFSNVFLHLQKTNRDKNISDDKKDEIILKTAADAKRVGWVFKADEKALEQQLLGILTPILQKMGMTFDTYFKTTSTDISGIEEANKSCSSIGVVPKETLAGKPEARKYVRREKQKPRKTEIGSASEKRYAKAEKKQLKPSAVLGEQHTLKEILKMPGAFCIRYLRYRIIDPNYKKLIETTPDPARKNRPLYKLTPENRFVFFKDAKQPEGLETRVGKSRKEEAKGTKAKGRYGTFYLDEIAKMRNAYPISSLYSRVNDPRYKPLVKRETDPKNAPKKKYDINSTNEFVVFKDAEKPEGLEAKVKKSRKEETKGAKETGRYGTFPLEGIAKMPDAYGVKSLYNRLGDKRFKKLEVKKTTDPNNWRKKLYTVTPKNEIIFFKDAKYSPDALEKVVKESRKEEAKGTKESRRYGTFYMDEIIQMPHARSKKTIPVLMSYYKDSVEVKREVDPEHKNKKRYTVTRGNEFIFFKDAKRPEGLESKMGRPRKEKTESAGKPESAGKEKDYSPKSTDTDKKYTASFSSIYLLVLPDDARKEWLDKGWSGKAGELSHYAMVALADKGLVSKRGDPYFFDPKDVGTIVDMVCKEFEWAKKPEEIKFVMTLSATKDYLKFAHDVRLSVELLEGKYGDLKMDFNGMKVFSKDKVDYAVDKKQFTPVSIEEVASTNNLPLESVQAHRDVLEPIRIRAGEQSGYCLRAVPEAVTQLKKLCEAESTKA